MDHSLAAQAAITLALAPILACAGPAGLRAPGPPPATATNPPHAATATGAHEPVAPPVEVPDDVTKELKARLPGLPELEIELEQLQAAFDIPIDVNEEVVACIRRFQSPEFRPHVLRWLSRSHRYEQRFRAILRAQGLPEDLVYVAMIESGFEPRATSRARAVGIWQFIATTGRQYGLRRDFWVDERRDPEKAAQAAARFLKALYARTGDWYLALAAYNAGPGRIARAMEGGHRSFWDMARRPDVLPRETRAYVPNVLGAAIVARFPEAFGFRPEEIEPLEMVEYEAVRIPRSTSLSLLARAAGITVSEIRDLNPELRRGSTPPRPYALKIPREKKAAFVARWPRVAAAAKKAIARHRVKRGDTLWTLSRKHGVTVRELARWNGIAAPETHVLQVGRILRVKVVRGQRSSG